MKRDWIGIVIPILLAVGSMMISGYVGYSATTATTNARVSVVEAKQEDFAQRLDRIENKLDTIIYYLTGKK